MVVRRRLLDSETITNRVGHRFGRRYSGRLGFVASVKASEAPVDAITADSRDVIIDPNTGAVVSRLGRVTQFEAAPAAPVGLLEFKDSMKPRHGYEFVSGTLADGWPSVIGLFSNESIAKKFGQFWWRSTNAGLTQAEANHTFGEEFSATTYPVDGSRPVFRMVPIPYVSKGAAGATSGTGMTRCAYEYSRRFTAAGARDVGFYGDRALTPNLDGTPMEWDQRWLDKTTTVTDVLRARPWSPCPPLFAPTFSFTSASGSANQNWRSGDACYYSMAGQRRDGSWTRPFQIRPNRTTPARGGLCIVGDGTTATYHAAVLLSNLPIMGPEIARRAILRTYKVNVNTVDPAPEGFGFGKVADIPLKLYIVKILEDNAQTAYSDENGSNDALESADIILGPYGGRDLISPPAARHVADMDERVILGYSRMPATAGYIAPTGVSTTRDLNQPDTVDAAIVGGIPSIYGALGGGSFAYRIFKDMSGTVPIWAPPNSWRDYGSIVLQLCYFSSIPSAPAVTSITLRAAPASDVPAFGTLQDIIDEIQETVVGGAGKEWVMQAVGGIDPAIRSDTLALTEFLVPIDNLITLTGITSFTISCAGTFPDGFQDVALGMGFRISSGTGSVSVSDLIVTAKSSDASVTLARRAGGIFNVTAGTATVAFFVDTGDNGLTSGTERGYVRAFGGCFPAPIGLRGRWLDLNSPIDKRSLWISAQRPSIDARMTTSLTANAFYNDPAHRRSPPAKAGHFMGLRALEVGGVAAYSRAVYLFSNRRDGNSGEDIDYRFAPINRRRGCISPYSLVEGDGWVGYLTRDGYVVTDSSRREVIITGALHNPSVRTGTAGHLDLGVLKYELEASGASADSDGDDYGFHAWLDGTKLVISYRFDAATRYRQEYDFSPTSSASGLAEVLRPDGTPYPWSAPLTTPVVAGVSVGANSSTTPARHFGFLDTNAGSTGDGQIQQLDTTFQDDGVNFVPIAYFRKELGGSNRRRHRISRVSWLGRARASGLKLLVANDRARTYQQAVDLLVNADDDPAEVRNVPRSLMRYAEVTEFGVRDDAVNSDRFEVRELEVEFESAIV